MLGIGAIWVRLSRRRWNGPVAAAVASILIAGMGFSVAAAIRHHGVQNHPLRSRVGQIVTAQLRVTDDPRSVTGGRAMVRADLVGLGDPVQGMTGAVLVFGSSSLLGRVAVGDTVRARARPLPAPVAVT